MQKAIILDRDGVINSNSNYYTFRKDDFVFVPGIFDALRKLKKEGFIFIVVTNQSGISKGIYTKNEVEELNRFMIKSFEAENIKIEEVYYCPHFSGMDNCICRKPDNLLVQKAIARFNIIPGVSWLIGDSERDITAGANAGLNTLKIESNSDLSIQIDPILSQCRKHPL